MDVLRENRQCHLVLLALFVSRVHQSLAPFCWFLLENLQNSFFIDEYVLTFISANLFKSRKTHNFNLSFSSSFTIPYLYYKCKVCLCFLLFFVSLQ